jgi:hypothetical protein
MMKYLKQQRKKRDKRRRKPAEDEEGRLWEIRSPEYETQEKAEMMQKLRG